MGFDTQLSATVGESIDRLLSAQIFMSGGGATMTSRNLTKELYEAARARSEQPLTHAAAVGLAERVTPRSRVLICTGFFDPPSMVDEADGPIGAAVLARALCVAFDAVPVIVTEVANAGRMEALVRAAGLAVTDYELALQTPFNCAILPLPISPERAEVVSRRIVELTDPVAMVSIEKPGPTAEGRYSTGTALDVTDVLGKVEHLHRAASDHGVWSIGIGDGGNEIGMGSILDTVHEVVPGGKGLGTVLTADVLVVSTIANWGTYGVMACLAAGLHSPEVLHADDDERRITDAAVSAGLIDPVTGLANGWVDGTPPICSASILALLRQMVELRLSRLDQDSVLNFAKRWKERGGADETVAAWARELIENEDRLFEEGAWPELVAEESLPGSTGV